MKQREETIPPHPNMLLSEARDRLFEFYPATNKPDDVNQWRSERAEYREVAPEPQEKK